MAKKYLNDSNVWYGRVYCVNLVSNICVKDAVYEFVDLVEKVSGRKIICTNFGAFSWGAILYYNFTFPKLRRKDVLNVLIKFMDADEELKDSLEEEKKPKDVCKEISKEKKMAKKEEIIEVN